MEPHHVNSFFTTMVHSSKTVVIPAEFLSSFQEDMYNTATLVGPTGDAWTVKVRNNSNGEIRLEQGWQKFCEDNFVGAYDVLLLSYEGCMRFGVKIFEPRGMKRKVPVVTEQQEPSPHAPKTTHSAPRKHPTKKKNTGQGNTSSGIDNEEVRRLVDPRNPHFEIEVKRTNGNKVFVPSKILREKNVELASTMTYSDPSGRMWKGIVGKWSDGRVYVTGWKSFVKRNKLENHDKCIFELVKTTREGARNICNHMNIHFVLPR